MKRRRVDPEALTIAEAIDQWLDRKQSETSAATVGNYSYRLKLFREFCDEVEIETVGELRPADIDQYKGHRAQYAVNLTLREELKTLRQCLEWLASIEAVDQAVPDAIELPNVDQEELCDETVLGEADARDLLAYYRGHGSEFGTLEHVVLELLWFTGARRGALVALDVRDLDLDEGHVEWRHRPETGTPLKNKMFGQRAVSLPETTVEAFERYLDQHRWERHDDEGRQPLLASWQGRPAPTTVTQWSYRATLPCIHGECPHGKEPEDCQYTNHNHASKCPSSRSPHQVRSGSITWQLNSGVPPEVVASRVDSSIKTIRLHYDWADEQRRWDRLHQHREQRSEHVDRLSIDSA